VCGPSDLSHAGIIAIEQRFFDPLKAHPEAFLGRDVEALFALDCVACEATPLARPMNNATLCKPQVGILNQPAKTAEGTLNMVKATTKKSVKKSAAKKSAGKKGSVKKSAPKKAVRKAVAKKKPVKKAAVKKSATKKSAAKKSSRKAATKKSSGKKVVRKPAARKPPAPPPSPPESA
jgi:hypothetical protein